MLVKTAPYGAAMTVALLLVTTAAQAQDPPPFPEFTFKRVKPPKAGSGPRIKVQITPQAPEALAAAPDPGGQGAAVPAARTQAYPWFWDGVSPALKDAGPGRLAQALKVLSDAPQAPNPRLQGLQDIAAAHGTDLLRATIGTRVSPALALAVISVESAGRADAVSSAGAQGLMQLIPATADRFGVEDAMRPAENIQGGVAYLDWLMGTFDNDPILVLAGYNAGENAVKTHEGVPPFAETRDYVPKVLAAWSVARGLCLTPPELVSDGCVFAVKGN